MKLKEMYQMITFGGDAELELLDNTVRLPPPLPLPPPRPSAALLPPPCRRRPAAAALQLYRRAAAALPPLPCRHSTILPSLHDPAPPAPSPGPAHARTHAQKRTTHTSLLNV